MQVGFPFPEHVLLGEKPWLEQKGSDALQESSIYGQIIADKIVKKLI